MKAADRKWYSMSALGTGVLADRTSAPELQLENRYLAEPPLAISCSAAKACRRMFCFPIASTPQRELIRI